jgi:hypothetical protein
VFLVALASLAVGGTGVFVLARVLSRTDTSGEKAQQALVQAQALHRAVVPIRRVVDTLRANCARGNPVIRGLQAVWRVQARSAEGIAADPFQSAKTRAVRANEARKIREALRVLVGAFSTNGRDSATCAQRYPYPPP